MELRTARAPELTLVLLHHAGGSADGYRQFVSHLPDHWRVLAAELPGRVHASRQHGCRSVAEAVDGLLRVLRAESGGAYAVFGHSMGALVAFELVRALERLGRPPLWLGLSGSPAPQTGGPAAPRRHTWPRERVEDFMRRLGGTPDSAWHHPVLAERMVRTMRWDLEVVDTYEYAGGPPLTTPLSLFAGEADPLAPPERVRRWREHTRASAVLHRLPGGHFYLFDRAADVCRRIVEDVTAHTCHATAAPAPGPHAPPP
ncbi:alpha/beta fold hydrolase [Streptomyces sp. WELS2]|uniref:thioesterase II family protein n=1 Tax=Streptomyces sp. WELS2 TaxID=2749435 RepID=UPI002867F0CC|nr:alpha/beta fold hydrolase [Streptomyces sp. WELS2]